MFLDLEIQGEKSAVEFGLEKVDEISDHLREWHFSSKNGANAAFRLSFKEEAFILKEITEKPEGLLNDQDQLEDWISEFLTQEHDIRQEGFDGSEDSSSDEEPQPYDPQKISIRNERWSIAQTFDLMVKWDEIDLNPDFQRNFIWDRKHRSQLIESLMLRIPVPAFYLAETDKGKYQVVDGLQRLTTVRDFMLGKFYLKGLEYLGDQEGRYFEPDEKRKGIDREFYKTIQLTQINVNIIEAKSPSKVKFDVFRRVNTGGKPLNNQEIRNCLANKETRNLINVLAHSESFRKATDGSVRTTRMQAQELVLRFIAFYHDKIIQSPVWAYKGNMTEYLDDSIERLNKKEGIDHNKVKDAFHNSMQISHHLFGEYAFRKCLPKDFEPGARRQLINKSLFTTWSVLLSVYDFEVVNSQIAFKAFPNLLAERLGQDEDFWYSVSYKTNDLKYMTIAFRETQKIIDEHLPL